jgi:hypothetical protein
MIDRETHAKLVAAFQESGMSEAAARYAANPHNEPIVRRCEALAHEARQREAAQLGRQREAAQLAAIDTDWEAREKQIALLESKGLWMADWRAELAHERHMVAWANSRGDTTYGATASLNERTPQSTPQRGTTALQESERDVYADIERRISALERKIL